MTALSMFGSMSDMITNISTSTGSIFNQISSLVIPIVGALLAIVAIGTIIRFFIR